MKKLLILLCASMCALNCRSAEINLNCSGIESFYSSTRGLNEQLNSVIEVRFDDVANKLIYISATRLFGCYPNGVGYKNFCNCSITESIISCNSESSDNLNFNSRQSVSVNRFTGILKFSEATSGGASGDRYSMFRSGDLKCESFTKKKF